MNVGQKSHSLFRRILTCIAIAALCLPFTGCKLFNFGSKEPEKPRGIESPRDFVGLDRVE